MPAALSAAPIVPNVPTARPDLKIAYTGDVSVVAGNKVNHVMTMTNQGAATPIDQQIVFIGSLPPGFEILTMSGANGVTCEVDNNARLTLEQHAHPLWACRVNKAMLTGSTAASTATVKAPTTPGAYDVFGFADYT